MKIPKIMKEKDPIYNKPIVGKIYANRLKKIINLTRPYNKKVLDVGFGLGVLFPYLVKYTSQENIFGIEQNKDKFIETKKILKYYNLNKINIFKGDIISNPYKKNKFDIIYALDVLEHIWDIDSALLSIKRIMKKEGILAVSLPSEDFFYSLGRKIVGFKKPKDHHRSANENKKILKKYFTIIKSSSEPFFPRLFKIYLLKK